MGYGAYISEELAESGFTLGQAVRLRTVDGVSGTVDALGVFFDRHQLPRVVVIVRWDSHPEEDLNLSFPTQRISGTGLIALEVVQS